MAFRRTFTRRVWVPKSTTTTSTPNPPLPPPPPPPPPPPRRHLPDVDDCRTLSFLQPRPSFGRFSTVSVPLPPHLFPALPVGDYLFDRLRLDGLAPPPPPPPPPLDPAEVGMTAAEARKVVRAAQMEVARARLRDSAESCVSASEFARLCANIAGGDESGRRLARALDESAAVIVLGDVVFLRPDMVAKAIGSVIGPAAKREEASEACRRELEQMEAQKAALDARAAREVRRELWCGLGLVGAQTLGFLRLTFWELSWDVMEPVCFFTTSLYFIVGYAFFMRTSRDPSFQGFFQSRFASRQRRLMEAHHFDVRRYNALKQGEGCSETATIY